MKNEEKYTKEATAEIKRILFDLIEGKITLTIKEDKERLRETLSAKIDLLASKKPSRAVRKKTSR